MVAARHQVSELAAKKQGAPHSTHVKPLPDGMSRAQPWGSVLPGWEPHRVPGSSQDSSIISLDDYSQYTTAELMQ